MASAHDPPKLPALPKPGDAKAGEKIKDGYRALAELAFYEGQSAQALRSLQEYESALADGAPRASGIDLGPLPAPDEVADDTAALLAAWERLARGAARAGAWSAAATCLKSWQAIVFPDDARLRPTVTVEGVYHLLGIGPDDGDPQPDMANDPHNGHFNGE